MSEPFTRLTVLVPTRNRVPQLQTMLQSFSETRAYLAADLAFRIDLDDPLTQTVVNPTGYGYVTGPRLDGYRSIATFFNEMRPVAQGDLFMCGNDDMVFRTPHWPELVLAEANKYPDGVFVLGVQTLNLGVFPFSIISRKAVEAMGFIHDPRLVCGDLFLRDVMSHFGRAIQLPNVHVEHNWGGFTPEHLFPDAE